MCDFLIGYSPSGKRKIMTKNSHNLQRYQQFLAKYKPRDGSKGFIPEFLRIAKVSDITEAGSEQSSSSLSDSEDSKKAKPKIQKLRTKERVIEAGPV